MGFGDVLDPETERIATSIVDAIFKVHSFLGPGLLESVYESCLLIELETRGLNVQRQVNVPIVYHGHTIEPGLRLDLLVERTPPGRIASTSLPCAVCLVLDVACRYLLVTFRLLWRR